MNSNWVLNYHLNYTSMSQTMSDMNMELVTQLGKLAQEKDFRRAVRKATFRKGDVT